LRRGGVTDGLGRLWPAIITGQHDGAQSPKTHAYLLNAIVLQAREDARAVSRMQLRKGAAVADDRQPLNRMQENAELALERFRTVAQERFDDLMKILPPLGIEGRGFRNDSRNHGTKDGGVRIERHSNSRYHEVAEIAEIRPTNYQLGNRRAQSLAAAMRKKPHEIDTGIPTVFSVSPVQDDHVALKQILNGSIQAPGKFKVRTSATLASALAIMRKRRIPIVLVEHDLPPDSWRDLLEGAARLAAPPLLIVTSRLADERLWAEAINVGAYDVLAKPFDVQEVCRVVEGAWRHWSERHEKRCMSASESW
jgi:ActR/RegA family two-component response regulator